MLIAGTVKCKVGQGLAQDAAACAAVREAIGASHTLRVDANMGWASVEEAAANINALAKYDLELVEQPLPRHDYAGLAALREETGVPIMVDESLWDPAECAVVVQAGAADVGNVYIAESGGILKASTNLAMCEAAGITCLIGEYHHVALQYINVRAPASTTGCTITARRCDARAWCGDGRADPSCALVNEHSSRLRYLWLAVF